MKNKKTGMKKRILQFIAVILVIVATAAFFLRDALAIFSEKSAVKYKEYASTHTVEDSTLFVGTYLIHINAVTDELYAQAQSSGSEANQTSIYYKSELAGGKWFDITNAEGLTDIMDTGTAVSDDEIGELYVQFAVDSSGTMTDALTGKTVNPFDVPNPYDLKKLPELQGLWVQYAGSADVDDISEEDYLKQKNSVKAGTLRGDVYNYQILKTFFGLNLKDSETDKCDADLARLFAAYQSLKSSDKKEEADIIYSLMAKVDAQRRAIVMDKLSGGELNCLGALNQLANGQNYTVFGNFQDSTSGQDNNKASDYGQDPEYIRELRDAVNHDFSARTKSQQKYKDDTDWWSPLQQNYDDYNKKYKETPDGGATDDGVPRPAYAVSQGLIDSISDSTQSCQTSYMNYKAQALSDSDTILGHAEYEYSKQVIEEADSSGAGGPITYLRDIRNIEQNLIKNQESEKGLLDSSLLNMGEAKFSQAVSSGVSEEYTNAMSMGTGASSADNVLDTQFGRVEACRSELEFLIDAYKQRDTAKTVYTYIQGAIQWTEGLYGSVPGDAFSSRATGSIDSHIKWLKDLAQKVKDSDESLKSKLDELNDKKEELQRKRDAALDDNDLASAKAYDEQIAAVDQDIADEEAKTGQTAGDSLADSILSDTLAELANDPDADISSALDALAGMGAVDALDKIKDRARNAGTSQAMMNNIDDAVTAGVNTMASGDGSTSDSVGGAAVNTLNSLKEQAEDDAATMECIDAANLAIQVAGDSDTSASDLLNAIGTLKDRAQKDNLGDDIMKDIDDALQKAAGIAQDKEALAELTGTTAGTNAGTAGADAGSGQAGGAAEAGGAAGAGAAADAAAASADAAAALAASSVAAALAAGVSAEDIQAVIAARMADLKGDIQKIKDKIEKAEGPGVSDDMMKAINSALDDMKKKAAAAGAAAAGSTAKKSGPDEAAIVAALKNALGDSLQDAPDDGLAVATAAVSRLAKSGNQAAAAITPRLADILRARRSGYLYVQYKDKTPRYINLKTIGSCTKYRYVYDDTRKTATMTRGAAAIILQVGSDKAKRTGSDEETLKNIIVKSADPYISEDDAKNYFNVTSEYLYGTNYALCLTEPMDTAADEMLKTLTGTDQDNAR
ncbi:MAG: hypothetical protein IIZ75_11290 [Lachnospiraceae bacterium]|nr:hypothetical protein [Lachnospiraceae bacterium]